jgi:hypothetical protein
MKVTVKKSVTGIPRRGCPALYTMKRVVEESNWVKEIASK